MIEFVSDRISGYLFRHNERRHVSREVMTFALIGLLTNGIVVLLCLLIGLLDGKFSETLFALIAIASMRVLAGGYHINPPSLCIVISTVIVVLIPFIPVNQALLFVFSGISALLVWRFAPADLRNSTRISERSLQQMKYAAILLVLSNFFLQSGIMAAAFLVVSLSSISFKGGGKKDE